MKQSKFLLLILLFSWSSTKGQDLDYLCDSVFHAVKMENSSMLMDLCPTYSDLKTVYDTTDMELANYKIGLRQKDLEYSTRKDMKNLKKQAKRDDVNLENIEKTEYVYEVLSNADGYRYAYVQAKCTYRDQPLILHFALIELNAKWFYGEGLRLQKLEVVKEETPNYEVIDRELERKQKEREKARIKAEEEKKKQEEIARKQKEKEEKERLKAEEDAKKLKEKEEKEKLKAEQKKKKEEELEAKRKQRELEKEEQKKKREQEKEEARKKREKEKEEARKKREEEKKKKEEEKKE